MSRRAAERARRLVRGPRAVGVGLALLILALAGCMGGGGSGADAEPTEAEQRAGDASEQGIAGSFVGELAGGRAFVAVVAEPAGSQGARGVEVYVSDGRSLGELFSGSTSDTSFVAKSGDGRRQARGTLRHGSLTGTIQLRSGKRVRFEASPPSGAAGLYDVTVSAGGDLSGASAAGLGIKGRIALGDEPAGTLELVDGKRVEFAVTQDAAGGRLRAAEVRVIVLPGGQVKGAGKGRPAAGDDNPSFFIRSA